MPEFNSENQVRPPEMNAPLKNSSQAKHVIHAEPRTRPHRAWSPERPLAYVGSTQTLATVHLAT